jgi:alpha-beta hydrolase superfamily lysophospholipase
MTALLAPETGQRTVDAVMRVSWRLSASGAIAACTVVETGRRAVLEIRTRDSRTVHTVPGLGPHSQLLPDDDGTVTMCHHRDGGHVVDRLETDGRITRVARSDARGFALVDRTRAIEFDARGVSTLVRLTPDGPVPIAELPGTAVSVVPLDDACVRLAVNIVSDGRCCSAVALDTATGAVEDFVSVSAASDDQVVHYVAAANLLVISTDATGETRLGIGRPGSEPVRFPAALAGAGPVNHVATSADGRMLAISIDVGAVSRIRVVDTASATGHDLDLPPLVVMGRGAITDHELIVPVSTPDRPGTLLHVDLSTGALRFADQPLGDAIEYDISQLPGADGEIEAVVVGNPATADAVVIALHGGPLAAWRAMFDPLLLELADAGIAVVAPNVRGSTGYGRAHALAIRDRWGDPDLADVLAIGEAVTAQRPAGMQPPIVLGQSYGAYLALLAATRMPALWSGCVALAPFVSGARIEAGSGPVAELVRRLGGTGSADLRVGLDSVSAPVLLVHGAHDDVIPIAESQLLHQALLGTGKNVAFLPMADAGHDLVGSAQRALVIDSVVAFCQDLRGPIGATTARVLMERRD